MTDEEFIMLIEKCKQKNLHISYSFVFGYINISLPNIPAKTFTKTNLLMDALNYIS